MAVEVPFNLSGLAGGATSAVNTVLAPVQDAFKALNNPLAFLGLTTARSIGGFSADVVLEEVGHDALQITEHPVEIGSQISDNAYKLQPEIRIRACWAGQGLGTGYVKQVYASLLALQESATLVQVTTGKRTYQNVLIQSLTQTTDAMSEYSLVIDFSLKQLKLVKTKTAQINPATVANPASTTAVQASSPQQATPATPTQATSLLKMGANLATSTPPTLNVRAGDLTGGI